MNQRKKILIVFGTRPEAIKMAPLYWAFKKCEAYFDTKVCITRQHQTMLDQVLEDFEIRPDFEAKIPTGLTLSALTSHLVSGLEEILVQAKPDLVAVHGDTTTSFAASLCAFYNKIPVAHIEAGLRTYNHHSPWPEELNRQLTARLATYHFPPTEESKLNLHGESLNSKAMIVTGNTVIDALFWILKKIDGKNDLRTALEKQLNDFGVFTDTNKIVLITSHRRENHGAKLTEICNAIAKLATNNSDFNFVFPVHLNPNVQTTVKSILSNLKNVYLLPPLPYLSFVYLLSKSFLVMTDSGGLQEEAPSLKIPVLVLRDTTERPEAIASGGVKLVGTNFENIVNVTQELINNPTLIEKMKLNTSPYGDGTAAEKIVNFLKNNFA